MGKNYTLDEQRILVAFGSHVRTLRKKGNLTQEELAEKAEINTKYLGDVERGERNLSLLNIYKLAIGLNVSAHEILPPVPSPHNPQ